MFSSISSFESALNRGDISLQLLLDYQKEKSIPFRWHPLGFIVCNLITEGRFKVRFHFWPSSNERSQDAECQIHDHTFRFTSWVLAGEIQNIEYKNDKLGETYSLYEVEYKGDHSILNKTKRTIKLAVNAVNNHATGSKYEMQAASLHETRRVSSKSAVTVLITEDVLSQTPCVVGPSYGLERYEYVRTLVKESDLQLMLAPFLSRNE